MHHFSIHRRYDTNTTNRLHKKVLGQPSGANSKSEQKKASKKAGSHFLPSYRHIQVLLFSSNNEQSPKCNVMTSKFPKEVATVSEVRTTADARSNRPSSKSPRQEQDSERSKLLQQTHTLKNLPCEIIICLPLSASETSGEKKSAKQLYHDCVHTANTVLSNTASDAKLSHS